MWACGLWVSETKNAEDHVKSVDNASSGSCEGAVRNPGSDAAVASAETLPDAELSHKTPDITNNQAVKDSNDVAVDQASKSDETTSKKDKYMPLWFVTVKILWMIYCEIWWRGWRRAWTGWWWRKLRLWYGIELSNAHNRRFIASESGVRRKTRLEGGDHWKS